VPLDVIEAATDCHAAPQQSAFLPLRSCPMKLSARNQLPGTVEVVNKGATTAHVTIKLDGGASVTASITNEAVAELGLKAGDSVFAVIKASDVMVGKP
jgi:molybdopterin-binding protein